MIECYKMKKRISESDYLVGESKPSSRNSTNDSMSSPPSANRLNDSSYDHNSFFKRPSISNKEESESVQKQEEDSHVQMPPPQNKENVVEIPDDSPPLIKSPLRRSARKSAFVIDETDSPALRHKRVNELANKRQSNSPASPKTPGSGSSSDSDHNISNLVSDMPTPQKQITYAVLKEMQSKESPRTKRLRKLLETPISSQAAMNAEFSPMPELPDCMKPPDVNYALRPDASPNNMHYHKRKWDTLEPYFVEVPADKKTKYVPTVSRF